MQVILLDKVAKLGDLAGGEGTHQPGAAAAEDDRVEFCCLHRPSVSPSRRRCKRALRWRRAQHRLLR